MDSLSLVEYNRQGSVVDNSINSLDKFSKSDKKLMGNLSLSEKGLLKSDKKFIEFFINDEPLSKLLDNFYNSKDSILDNWIGVLGWGVNTKADIIKIKQLIGKQITDKDIRQAYPENWTENEFEWYLQREREELAKPQILIYCCAECGDYDCGGIAITIDRTDNSVTWIFNDSNKTLTFEFDKYLYFDVLNKYLKRLGGK